MDAGVLSSQEGDGCGGCWTQKLPPRGSSARVHARHSGACAKKPVVHVRKNAGRARPPARCVQPYVRYGSIRASSFCRIPASPRYMITQVLRLDAANRSSDAAALA